MWVPWLEKTESSISSVHPALLVHTSYESLQAEHVTIVPSLAVHDPLLHHIALVLQVALEGEGVAGQLYAKALADALVVHFLRRYAASRPSLGEVTGGLSPNKLRRTTAYIQEHLEQDLSLVTLAAVGQTSPAHFARLFRHATGLSPHQYVITCRMEQAKRLLAKTDMSLIEIGAPGRVCRPKPLHRPFSQACRAHSQSLQRQHKKLVIHDVPPSVPLARASSIEPQNMGTLRVARAVRATPQPPPFVRMAHATRENR